MEVRTEIEMVNIPIKVEPLEFHCEETTQHIETEAEMYENETENGAVFAPKRSDIDYKRNCKVPGCTSNAMKDQKLGFYSFPIKHASKVVVTTSDGIIFKVKDRLAVWLERCNLSENDQIAKYSVCSRHFTSDDYSKAGIYL
jgi:hypothetical protein